MKAIALAAAIGMVSGMAVTKPGMLGWAKHKVSSMLGGKSQCTPEQQAQMKAQCAAKQAQCAPKACCKK